MCFLKKFKADSFLVVLAFAVFVLGSFAALAQIDRSVSVAPTPAPGPKPAPKPATTSPQATTSPSLGERIDDWQFEGTEQMDLSSGGRSGGIGGMGAGAPAASSNVQKESIGLSTGGAKDVGNFRENLENDYLPLPEDITYEGLFYDYYFDTGQKQKCEQLFCPSYSYAVSEDPISKDKEQYLSVGLNSNIKKEDFERKKLNLIVVLDISGSMGSSFQDYYYDQFGNKKVLEEKELEQTKMEAASKATAGLLDHLGPHDRFGMVLYNSASNKAKPLRKVGETDMKAIKDHILEIGAGGGTRMSAGMKDATEMMQEYKDADSKEYENRIVFVTDAMPNLGQTSEEGLFDIMKDNSDDGIYSTFLGVGVDFNSELVNEITETEGANYYSVHSPDQFKERLDDEFEYMVTPLVFDLNLKLEADGYEIKKVYGSPEAEEATGKLMKVNTLFPSEKKEGKTRGGLVLVQLDKEEGGKGELTLKASYETRTGEKQTSKKTFNIPDKDGDFYQNKGIRKGILLSRYANLTKDWLHDQARIRDEDPPVEPMAREEIGIIPPPPFPPRLGKWERQSVDLAVTPHYKDLFGQFKSYFEAEREALGDDNLSQELEILNKLEEYPASDPVWK